ncbi:hypothetical protein Glove_364g35 [Diversispora epigaea]|uniref:TLDc domain-containing protein n=1 Tax=Diversispora epigaea TaxID=1348612 RepID=A0A397HDD6_9GLOM|nr:hypothetical protein Glove_364g35 [Diversispora epigaea]
MVDPDRPVKSVILSARSVIVTELPPRANEPKIPFSTIISEEHAAEISTWIDHKTTPYTSTNIPYEFELILRGSRDGFAPQTFWDMCYGHASTVVFMKVKGTNEILGGYNPLMWDNTTSGYKETKDSFIFSLKNNNILNSVLSRVDIPKCALYYCRKENQNKYGFNFGGVLLMCSNATDFEYYHDSRYNTRIKAVNGKFSIIDYEVFKINRKTT